MNVVCKFVSDTNVIYESTLLSDINPPEELCYFVVDSSDKYIGIISVSDYFYGIKQEGAIAREVCNINASVIVLETPESTQLKIDEAIRQRKFYYIPVITEQKVPFCFFLFDNNLKYSYVESTDKIEWAKYMLQSKTHLYVMENGKYYGVLTTKDIPVSSTDLCSSQKKLIYEILEKDPMPFTVEKLHTKNTSFNTNKENLIINTNKTIFEGGSVYKSHPPRIHCKSHFETIFEAYEPFPYPVEPEHNHTLHKWLPQSSVFAKEILPYIQEAIEAYLNVSPYVNEVNIADVGGGVGVGSEYIRARLQIYFDGYGYNRDVKINMTNIDTFKACREWCNRFYPKVNFLPIDIFEHERVYDFVFSSACVEHVSCPESFVKRMQYLTKHLLFVYVPYNESPLIPGHVNTIDDRLIALLKMYCVFIKTHILLMVRKKDC